MNEDQVQRLVAEVISRLAARLGADGRQGLLVGVCTGATVELGQAVAQLRNLIWQGYRLQLAFTGAAQGLYGELVQKQLAGLPHVQDIDPKQWLTTLQEARAVVVPLLSVNTLSKLSLLLADNLPTNLILHALLMGKPVIVASDGADPHQQGRRELGFDKGNRALQAALTERLTTLRSYGCTLTGTGDLSTAVTASLGPSAPNLPAKNSLSSPEPRPPVTATSNVVTATQVTHAHRQGKNLRIPRRGLVTPLARELAARLRVQLLEP